MASTFVHSTSHLPAATRSRSSSSLSSATTLRSFFGLPAARTGAHRTLRAFGATPEESVFGQLWSPGLLDNLHEPLSRYHE
jgi:hypothetical protein